METKTTLLSLPLHDAIRNHKSEQYILKCLTKYENDIDVDHHPIRRVDQDGNMPLHLAFQYRQSESLMMQLIDLYPQALVHANHSHGDYPLHLLLSSRHKYSKTFVMNIIHRNPIILQHVNHQGNYPLHMACHPSSYQSNHDLLSQIIDLYPAAAKCPNHEGNYPLHIACYRSDSHRIILKLLDVYPLAATQANHKDGNLPFHIACQRTYNHFHEPILMILATLQEDDTQRLDSNSSSCRIGCRRRNRYGRTPFHEACYHHHRLNVDFLLQYVTVDRVDHNRRMINDVDKDGNTPFHLLLDGPIVKVHDCIYIAQILLHDNHTTTLSIDHTNHHGSTICDILNEKVMEEKSRKEEGHRNNNDDDDDNNTIMPYTTILALLNTFVSKRNYIIYNYMLHQFCRDDHHIHENNNDNET
jgi:ankyrin repeat protein